MPKAIRPAMKMMLWAAAIVLLPLLVAGGMTAARLWGSMRPVTPRPLPIELPAPPVHDPARRIAVVVVGNGGAEMTDFLIPYETLGVTGAFDLYVVAPERQVVPLGNAISFDGGLDLVPHFSLAEYEGVIGRAPDLIVIPYLPMFERGGEPGLVPWVRRQADAGALVVSICAGSEVLAATGLVSGQRATTHPNFFARLEQRHPDVTWVRGTRWVETPRAIASGAIASGMDATLAAIRRVLGRPAALEAARRLGYRHTRFLDDPTYGGPDFSAAATFASLYRPTRIRGGVLVYDGIGEVELGSLFDTLPLTTGYRLTTVGVGREVVTTRHGIHLFPRTNAVRKDHLDELLVPGTPPSAVAGPVAEIGARHRLAVTQLDGNERFGYETAIAEIARRDGAAVARAVAINLNYPPEDLALPEGPAPVAPVACALLLALGPATAIAMGRRRWGKR